MQQLSLNKKNIYYFICLCFLCISIFFWLFLYASELYLKLAYVWVIICAIYNMMNKLYTEYYLCTFYDDAIELKSMLKQKQLSKRDLLRIDVDANGALFLLKNKKIYLKAKYNYNELLSDLLLNFSKMNNINYHHWKE